MLNVLTDDVEILNQKAVAPQSFFAPILLEEECCIPPLKTAHLMSTELLSPHIEPDFQFSNIPIPPLLKLRKKWLRRNDFLGSKCVSAINIMT